MTTPIVEEIRANEAKVTALRDALHTARAAIKALHGEAAWEIFESDSPEMKQIDAAIRLRWSDRPAELIVRLENKVEALRLALIKRDCHVPAPSPCPKCEPALERTEAEIAAELAKAIERGLLSLY